jgi:1-piperideine-2-carboxylate/1-pyrroline-2-carboxylate reductase [NAD(P)H]
MKILNARETANALPWPGMREALIQVLVAQSARQTQCPVRNRLDIGDPSNQTAGTLLTMPASDATIAVDKVVTVHPSNRQDMQRLPVVQAAVFVIDAQTGERLALLDGDEVTQRRTAALSALAVERISGTVDHAQSSLLVVGAGAQARAHIIAFNKLLGVKSVAVHARRQEQARELIDWAWQFGIRVQTAVSNSVSNADIIVTATNSVLPVIEDEIKINAVVCGVGAFTSKMAELPASLVQRSHCVVDTMEGCVAEAGDLLQAKIDWGQVRALHEFERTAHGETRRPTVFKSVGSALWDLAAAHCYLRSK